MSYVVNQTARLLKTGKGHIIGLGISLGSRFASVVQPVRQIITAPAARFSYEMAAHQQGNIGI